MIVFVDVDHVLSDAAWRDNLMPNQKGERGSWDEYHEAGCDDKPVKVMVDLLHALKASGHVLVGSTARPEKWRKLTMDWFVKHDVPLDELMMRADKDFRPSPQVKISHAKDAPFWPDLVIDDRDDICAAFCAEGVVTLMANVCGVKS